MQIGFYKDEAYDRLYRGVDRNQDKYFSDEDWVPAFLESLNEKYEEFSYVEPLSDFDPVYEEGPKTDQQKAKNDCENAINFHRSYRNLNRYQACLPTMWTYLCHQPKYRKYLCDRWLTNERGAESIRKRFFVRGRGENLFFENGLSRLWWIPELTYDEKHEDPYHLTKVLFQNQRIGKDILTTNNRMSPNRIRGILKAIEMMRETTDDNLSEIWRECRKYFNRQGAIIALEFLSEDEIQRMAYSYMMKVYDKRHGITTE